ncbi:MAG TPA: hypothetical protein PKD09_17100 [Aggregatilinea sp.]|uniref:hypothetical protein n=1 Tax=Aggregatilinea sp. TaxID=2806333 RepID=UPI002BD0F09E|nr:hypothetical protein [Aggregatilinea sp.]HML23376.1 hypothetical protein [Aggregatilinea sp.]
MNGTPTSPAPNLRRDLQIISDQIYAAWLDAIDQYGGAGSIPLHLADAHLHLMCAREALDPRPVRAESSEEHAQS